MNILVTGASGSIASYVLRELAGAGHTVVCFSRTSPVEAQGVGYIRGDFNDSAQISDAVRGRDAIVYLAAVPGPGRASPQEMFRVNLIGLVNVLEAAVQLHVPKVVFASSGAATGFSFQKTKLLPRYLPLDEAHPSEPQDEFGYHPQYSWRSSDFSEWMNEHVRIH